MHDAEAPFLRHRNSKFYAPITRHGDDSGNEQRRQMDGSGAAGDQMAAAD